MSTLAGLCAALIGAHPGIKRRHYIVRALLSFLSLALPIPALCGQADPSSRPQIQAYRTARAPHIDGSLDDPVWRDAQAIEAFLQREPLAGAPASERTLVRILYDDDNLYFGFRCLDSEPDKIIANRMQRDAALDENDNIQIILDTYDDRRGGFFFSTNPLGARRDALLSNEGRTRNESWDCVWTCRTSRDAGGWSAEIAIPFDQLRYTAAAEALWGINLGRVIRRKNEDVYVAPPPQVYGFRGGYRTSRLAALRGLGQLRVRPRPEITPFAVAGSEKAFEDSGSALQNNLDMGLDFRYRLASSLSASLSYKTDFAQAEADQEQVNLTRFSLFFPEKRDFFLEGASIFDFGERLERSGGTVRPPTLLFYSRRIGIQDGHHLPVLLGSKITGRVGSYEIGALNMIINPKKLIDEEEEERFLSAAGELLDEDDPRLDGATIVDTIEVEKIDTVQVARTSYSVLRLRRDVLGSSNVGFIAIDKNPGEDAGYNRAAGADASFSFFDATLDLQGFVARTWSPAAPGKEAAAMVAVEHRMNVLETKVSYLDIQENFNPEVGFVPRADSRRLKGSVRYRPRSQLEWIRRYSMGPRLTYLMDQNQVLQTRDFEFSSYVNLEAGDWIGVRYRDRFELLDEPFEIHDDIEIPPGDYSFGSYSLVLFSNRGRPLSGRVSYESGDFFDGRKNRLSGKIAWKLSGQLTIDTDCELNRIKLPAGELLTRRFSNRFLYSFTPDFFVRGIVQWNSKSEVGGANFLLSYRYLPGSDLFLVYNQVWDTDAGWRRLNRVLQFKLTYFWKP